MCTNLARSALSIPITRAIRRACVALIATASFAAAATTYPVRPVHVIVPFAAGGTSDVVTRIVSDQLAKLWGVPVVVENRPGAGGNIGAEAVARSRPDGYTLLMGTVATHGINASLYGRMPYDPVKNFEPVSLVASTPSVLMVSPKLPIHSVADLVNYARSHPNQLNFGSAGNGSSHHLAGEMFEALAGVSMTHVPYKGTAAAITDLIGGQIQLTFDTLPSAMPHVRAGTLRALGVTSRDRYPALPSAPTIATTVPGYEIESWYGVLAPAGTPSDIVAKLAADLASVLQQPFIREKLLDQGARPVGSTPEQFAEHIRSELKKWSKVVKDSGARIE